jgi:hypothetical protein
MYEGPRFNSDPLPAEILFLPESDVVFQRSSSLAALSGGLPDMLVAAITLGWPANVFACSALYDGSLSALAVDSHFSASLSSAETCSAVRERYTLQATTDMKVIINTKIILSPIFASLFIFNLLAEIDDNQFPSNILKVSNKLRRATACLQTVLFEMLVKHHF